MAEHDPMTDVACAEPALSDEVREALTLLRERSDDNEFCGLVDEVLAGRCSLVDASGTAAFAAAVFAPIAQEFGADVERMARDEKLGAAVPAGSSGGPCGGCTSICAAPCLTRASDQPVQ